MPDESQLNQFVSYGFTRRQSSVVTLAAEGLSTVEIADKLCVADKTIKFHLTNIYALTGFKRLKLIIWANSYLTLKWKLPEITRAQADQILSTMVQIPKHFEAPKSNRWPPPTSSADKAAGEPALPVGVG